MGYVVCPFCGYGTANSYCVECSDRTSRLSEIALKELLEEVNRLKKWSSAWRGLARRQQETARVNRAALNNLDELNEALYDALLMNAMVSYTDGTYCWCPQWDEIISAPENAHDKECQQARDVCYRVEAVYGKGYHSELGK